ncbi:outer membrane protein assembly factor BamB family protein [Agromyces albus]|uniref:outer membrane protein assembly factor BamB family protein n=1 Tax=Agromyces albus TaxID=205332 RepID=UPI0027D7D190|nr:PQQ-binding-like beta-propeller repeat protein [Agromyces albus]
MAVDSAGSFAVVAGIDGRIRAVDLSSMRASVVEYPVATRVAGAETSAASVAFLDDDRLVIGSIDAVGIVDVAARDRGPRFALPPGFANRAIAPVGSVVVTAGDRGILAMDGASGAVLWRQEIDQWSSACTSLSVSMTRGAAWCGSQAGEVVQYDLATGSTTARFPQRASGVFPSADGTEVVMTGTEEPVLSRWALDGRGAITRVIARGSTGIGGYDPDGSALLVVDDSARVHVWDPRTDASRVVLPGDTFGHVWAGIDALLVNVDGRAKPTLLDATTGELLPSDGVPEFSFTELTWTSGRRVQVVEQGAGLVVVEPTTGERVSGPFNLDSMPNSVSSLPDDSGLLVTTAHDGVFTTRMLDAESGEPVSPDLVGPEITTLVGDAVVVGAEGSRLLTYAIDDFAVMGSLPSTSAGTRTLQASADGRTLLATGIDGSASLFDLESGLRLGDAIPSAGEVGFAASLRPDGRELAVVLADGMQLWDLDSGAQAEAACRVAGRDLTREEWDEHLGAIAPYRSTCGFGLAGD